MGNHDYIPRPDADFDIWQDELISTVEPKITEWGIPEETLTPVKAKQTEWNAAYKKAANIQTRSRADVRTKDDIRNDFEKLLRGFVLEWLTFNSAITASEKESMNLKPRPVTRTPTPVPTSVPVGKIDVSERLRHIVHFGSEPFGRKGKPRGVHACEVWMKKGGDAAPVDPSELTFVCSDTNSPATIIFDGEDAGKTIYYWLRWVNTKSEPGPWSAAISGVVNG